MQLIVQEAGKYEGSGTAEVADRTGYGVRETGRSKSPLFREMSLTGS